MEDINVPFWENPQYRNYLKDPQIIRGLNLLWWAYIANSIGRDVRNKLRTDVQAKFEAIKEQYKAQPSYIKFSKFGADCEAFLAEEFSQDFWS
jgi:hypothetical protein